MSLLLHPFHRLARLSRLPVLVGVVGEDAAGGDLEQLLEARGVEPGTGLVRDGGRRTTLKTRIIAHHQQVLRADEETKEAAEIAAAAPTASKESAGIGPQSIETETIVRQGEGSKQEVVVSNGQKKTVRVIAPDIIPVPHAQN